MAADTKLMEAILRIEHKIDLLLARDGMKSSELTKLGSATHSCPVCAQTVNYDVDINDAVVVRRCGCSTGKIAIDLKAFAPPLATAKKDDDNDSGPEQEDWRNPNRGRGNRGR